MNPVNFQNKIAGYHLIEKVGSGGMGDVYKAYHSGLNRMAAIKFLHQKDLSERFKNEAYIQASVNHPNIARLYEYSGNTEAPCIIMEYVEGESLDTYLHKKGKLTSEETERILVQIVSAIAYLHEMDILHRDIKPQNFKIQPDGKIKMLDFGISKHKYTPKLTQEGFVVGTTEYMAPEQFDQKVEKKSDIWSLGVLTYELLTGYMPFESNNPISLRAKIVKASFTDPKILAPHISEKLSTIIEKSLRVNPSGRISAAEINKMLGGKSNPIVPQAQELVEKKPRPGFNFSVPKIKLPKINTNLSRFVLPLIIVLVVVLVSVIIANMGPSADAGADTTDSGDTTAVVTPGPVGKIKRVSVDVPGTEATLVFPDGSKHITPFEISGNEGEHIKFKVQAEGYYDTTIEFELNPILPYTYFVLPAKKP